MQRPPGLWVAANNFFTGPAAVPAEASHFNCVHKLAWINTPPPLHSAEATFLEVREFSFCKALELKKNSKRELKLLLRSLFMLLYFRYALPKPQAPQRVPYQVHIFPLWFGKMFL